jgi:hypothetical protein
MESSGEILWITEIVPFRNDGTAATRAPIATKENSQPHRWERWVSWYVKPLAIEMARERFQVTGIDLVKGKVDSINSGISYVLDVSDEALLQFVSSQQVKATQSLAAVEAHDTINI